MSIEESIQSNLPCPATSRGRSRGNPQRPNLGDRSRFIDARVLRPAWLALVLALSLSLPAFAQDLPKTPGETLSGRHVLLADEVGGHAAVLVAGFSREGGNGTAAWVKAIHADSALAGIPVYEIAQIAGAPGLIRGMIKSGMKKSVPATEHDRFVVLTQDEKPWRTYFDVGDDQVPYVAMIDASGKVLWRGHGLPAELEPKLKDTLKAGAASTSSP